MKQGKDLILCSIILFLFFPLLSACHLHEAQLASEDIAVQDDSTDYKNFDSDNHFTVKISQEIREQYPEDFYVLDTELAPNQKPVKIRVKEFTAPPELEEIAKMLTETFISALVKSEMFEVIDPNSFLSDSSNRVFEEQQDLGIGNSLSTNLSQPVDYIIQGTIHQTDTTMISTRVINVRTGLIDISDQTSVRRLDKQNLELLAYSTVSKILQEHFQ